MWLGNVDRVGKGKGKGKEGNEEEEEEKEEVGTVCSSFPVFLRTLTGRTVVLTAVNNSISISDLLQRIEEVTQIPHHHWYCHVNGSPVSHDSAPHILHRDCTIVMCARLKGGAPGYSWRMVLPGVSTWRVLASSHTLLPVWPEERCNKVSSSSARTPGFGSSVTRSGNCFLSHGTSACPSAGVQEASQ